MLEEMIPRGGARVQEGGNWWKEEIKSWDDSEQQYGDLIEMGFAVNNTLWVSGPACFATILKWNWESWCACLGVGIHGALDGSAARYLGGARLTSKNLPTYK